MDDASDDELSVAGDACRLELRADTRAGRDLEERLDLGLLRFAADEVGPRSATEDEPKRVDLELANAYFRIANGMGKAGVDLARDHKLIADGSKKADELVSAAVTALPPLVGESASQAYAGSK